MTATTDTTYQGWKNYETWAVKLWIDNEESSSLYWTESAAYIWDGTDTRDAPHLLTRSESARLDLADMLKDEITDAAPNLGASMFADLLNAALSEVDWLEIADNMLGDTEGYEAQP